MKKFFLQLWKSDFDDFLQITGNKCIQTKVQRQRLKQPTGLIFCILLSRCLNSANHEKLVRCLYPCPDRYPLFHDNHQKDSVFRQTN